MRGERGNLQRIEFPCIHGKIGSKLPTTEYYISKSSYAQDLSCIKIYVNESIMMGYGINDLVENLMGMHLEKYDTSKEYGIMPLQCMFSQIPLRNNCRRSNMHGYPRKEKCDDGVLRLID